MLKTLYIINTEPNKGFTVPVVAVPGSTTMTSTPHFLISSRRHSLKASKPNFTVQKGDFTGDDILPRILNIFTTLPKLQNQLFYFQINLPFQS